MSVSYKTVSGGIIFIEGASETASLQKRCAGKEFKRENMVNTIYELAWIFFIYSFIGWCGEVIVAAVNRHKFVNRGFIAGPLCPIYGTGAVAVAVFLPELKENLIFLFIGGMIVTSFVEYITGRLMEKILHKKWWDYSDQKFHLDGYICLRVSAFMGRVQCTDDLLPESVFLRSCQYDTPFDRRSDLMGAFRPAYCGWSRFGNCGS